MIEKMKVVSIVAQASQKDALLDGLKKLGLLHVREKQCADPNCLQRISDLSAVELALQEYAPETPSQALLSDEDFQRIYQKVKMDRTVLEDRLKSLQEQAKQPVNTEEKAKALVKQFLDSALTSRELLVSLIERVELTEEKEIIIKFRFHELEAIS